MLNFGGEREISTYQLGIFGVSEVEDDTVDGRNPANQLTTYTIICQRFFTSQVVQDFFNQQSINSKLVGISIGVTLLPMTGVLLFCVFWSMPNR